MITEQQYIKAIKIVREYLSQVEEEISSDPSDILKIPIEVRNITLNDKLSTRTLNGINMCYSYFNEIPSDKNIHGYYGQRFEAKIKGLMSLNISDLLKTRNFGKKSIQEIQDFLIKYNLQLK